MTDLMLTNLPVLASADGGLNYLHGLLFLILCLTIGAASKHFLKIFPGIPLPFGISTNHWLGHGRIDSAEGGREQ